MGIGYAPNVLVLTKIGLPVKCSWGDCETKGFVKPQTDYGGWIRRWHRKWYCPSHAKKAKDIYDNFVEKYKTPDPEPDDTAELYKLLED